ncbi:hypothetical protein CASFOL_041175 [Castilleja foliolosa]|uniref:Uncharacterized protein n=1 Tax=Castilleja foliolosa TaxID=1961234 RepID=A0ABD3BEB0_9LAMI
MLFLPHSSFEQINASTGAFTIDFLCGLNRRRLCFSKGAVYGAVLRLSLSGSFDQDLQGGFLKLVQTSQLWKVWAVICIFVESSNSVDALRVDKVMYEHARLFDCVNKRGCLFALDLVSDLLKHGYQPDGEAKETFDELFQEYDGNTFAEKVHRLELMELCADFTRMISDIPGGMETTPVVHEVVEGGEPKIYVSSHRSPPFPCSELCDKAGFSCNRAYFCPEDPNWLTCMGETKLWDESYFGGRGRRIIQPKVSEDEHKDQYSILPDTLRISCRRMDKYSESDLICYTRNFLFSDGHITPIVWHLRRLAIHVRSFSLENEVEVLAILGETSIINNFLFWHHRRWVSEKI